MGPPQLPPINKNLYNKGANAGANGASGRISYPDNITCYVCARTKPQSAYSTRQLNNWKATIYQPYAPGGRVKSDSRTTCKQCTPGQTTELTCVVCGETNGLNYFAKTQRKNPDAARCKKCILLQADTAPDLAAPNPEDYADSDEEDDDIDSGVKIDRRTVGRPLYSTDNNDDDDDEWKDVKGRGPNTLSTLTYMSGSTTPSAHTRVSQQGNETKRTGWAKPNKISKQQELSQKAARRLGYNDEDDDDEDDEGDFDNSPGQWKDKKPELKSEFDDDPWSRVYK